MHPSVSIYDPDDVSISAIPFAMYTFNLLFVHVQYANRLHFNLTWNPFCIVLKQLYFFLTSVNMLPEIDECICYARKFVPENVVAVLCNEYSLDHEQDGRKTTLRWLHPNERQRKQIALVSYPRSGNSLVRSIIQEITGVYTGCDTDPNRPLSKRLQEGGMKGEVFYC